MEDLQHKEAVFFFKKNTGLSQEGEHSHFLQQTIIYYDDKINSMATQRLYTSFQ